MISENFRNNVKFNLIQNNYRTLQIHKFNKIQKCIFLLIYNKIIFYNTLIL